MQNLQNNSGLRIISSSAVLANGGTTKRCEALGRPISAFKPALAYARYAALAFQADLEHRRASRFVAWSADLPDWRQAQPPNAAQPWSIAGLLALLAVRPGITLRLDASK